MPKIVRTTLSLVVSLGLFTALAVAQADANNAQKDKNKEHHSRLAKVEFWRHHRGSHKKQGNAKQAPSSQAQSTAAETKPALAKQAAGKKDQKREQHASKVSKVRTRKASAHSATKSRTAAKKRTAMAHSSAKSHHAAKKAKLGPKTQDRTTASLRE